MTGTTGADVIVVGLGAMGSATLYQLARRKVSVLGIDRFHPPHDRGSSHGETRITRQAIGEGADYVPFVLRSHQIWRELEGLTGGNLMEQVGALLLSTGGNATMHHGVDFVGRSIANARRYGIAHDVLNASQIAERFPQFRPFGDTLGYYEPGGGFVRPENCIAAQLAEATRHGARTRLGETVTAVTARPGGVAVRTDRGEYHARHAVITAGAWLPGLLGGWYRDTLQVRRQVLFWFEATDPDLWRAERCPIFIRVDGSRAEDGFYGFPMLPGQTAIKVGSEQDRVSTDPDKLDPARPEEAAAAYRDHVAIKLNGIGATCVRSMACLYTVAPRHQFVVERHPEIAGVTVVSACSGHGFKHSAGLGEALAQQAIGEAGGLDISVFARERAALNS